MIATVAALLASAASGGLVGDPPLAQMQAETDTNTRIPALVEHRGAPHEPDGSPAPSPTAELQRNANAGKDPDPRGEPTRIVIPAIDVDVDLVRLGLKADGTMQVPAFGFAGWYTEGPEPGHPGPAVIAAHRDSLAGPDVFYRLGDLTAGDEIRVVFDSGDDVTFLVAAQEQTPKDKLPIGAIWPSTNDRRLTLITCGGVFDRRGGHYRDNLIVYAAAPASA